MTPSTPHLESSIPELRSPISDLQSPPADETAAWYCIRTQPKHEHIAAARLRQLPGVETFLPRLRYRQATRRGPVWFTESLFPCYVFAQFALGTLLHEVRYAFGVIDVVHFGGRWPVVANHVINDLRQGLGENEVHELFHEPQPGDEVQISLGPFQGLKALVQRYLPARQRVQVLLEFLGQPVAAEFAVQDVVWEDRVPVALAAACR